MRADSPRLYLETEIKDRASHTSAEHVRTTCSFARAERLFGREYHGRFLIELLQNAADASRGTDGVRGRSSVIVQITEEPALLVANQGLSPGFGESNAHAAYNARWRSRSNFARPYMLRLIAFNFVILPSVCPLE